VLDDLYHLRDRARQASLRGDYVAAEELLLAGAAHAHVAEHDYVSVLRPLVDVLSQRGNLRGALSVEWYLSRNDPNLAKKTAGLLASVPPVDRARAFAASGDMARAAREMENAGLVAAAAIYREKADEWQEARALWSRLAQVAHTGGAAAGATATARAVAGTARGTHAHGRAPDSGGDAYQAALVEFNLARCARRCGDPRQAREATVAAIRLLEEAADHFETVGQRERAFDCFQVLVQIGRESGMFEDVLEGFVNCIRILREDHLKYFALQYFDDAVVAARERHEYAAAATLAREAADYARAIGLGSASAHYTLTQADLWQSAAAQQKSRAAPPAIAEHALLAAALALGEAGQFGGVGRLYTELAQLDVEAARRAHYARAAKRYAGVRDEPIDASPLPPHLRQDAQFPDVWHVDLIEWEQHGSASEACADVLLDKRWPDLIRRRALLARLTALAVEDAADDEAPWVLGARVRLAEQLAQLQLYAALSPLERLFERPERAVKIAVLAAMQTLFFKRSFVTVRAGLRDPDPSVVEQAAKAVESLYFQHAFDPLVRIVQEAPQPSVRASALRAMARIDTAEAAEFLLSVLEHGAPSDRGAALEALKRSRGMRFVELARAAMPTSNSTVQQMLRDVLRSRGYTN
jgi:hypothetical protein